MGTELVANWLKMQRDSLRATLDAEAAAHPYDEDTGEGFANIGFCEVVPGAGIVASYAFPDDESGCGIAWVRLIQIYPAIGVARPATDYDGCGTLLGFDYEIGIGRCIPVENPDAADGSPPSPDVYAAIALDFARDALVLRKAVKCAGYAQKDYRLGSFVPFGPQGLLGGGVWQVQVAL